MALRVVRVHDDPPDALRQATSPKVAAVHLRHEGEVPRVERPPVPRQPHQQDQEHRRQRRRLQRRQEDDHHEPVVRHAAAAHRASQSLRRHRNIQVKNVCYRALSLSPVKNKCSHLFVNEVTQDGYHSLMYVKVPCAPLLYGSFCW